MSGYINDHRKEMESAVWKMPPLYHRVWQWLKYEVNYADAKIPMIDGSFITVKRGQKLTSVRGICKDVGWWEGAVWKEPNPKTINGILKWMVKNNMITIDNGRGNRQYTLVTVVKYDFYNNKNVGGNSKVTENGQGREQQADINNKNNINNKNKKDIKPLSDKSNIAYVEIIDYLNEQAGTKFKHSTASTQKHIKARWNEKFTLDDFKSVIDTKVKEWKGTSMDKYIRPETLFGTKFESYLNQEVKDSEDDFLKGW